MKRAQRELQHAALNIVDVGEAGDSFRDAQHGLKRVLDVRLSFDLLGDIAECADHTDLPPLVIVHRRYIHFKDAPGAIRTMGYETFAANALTAQRPTDREILRVNRLTIDCERGKALEKYV